MGLRTKIKNFRNLWKAMDSFSGFTQIVGGVAIWPGTKKKNQIASFSTNIDVYRVISKVLDAIKTIPVILNNGKGKNKIQIEEHDLLKLRDKPNRSQTWHEFASSAIAYKMITGDGYIHAPIHVDGVNKGRPSEMFVMPSQHVTAVIKQGTRIIIAYDLEMDGLTRRFPVEEVIHWKEFNPFSEGNQWAYGMSKLMPGNRTVAVSNESQTSQKSGLQNQGASGMISYNNNDVENGPLGVAGQSQQNEDWEERYTGSINRGKTVWIPFNAKWQQMGMSPVDLQLINIQLHSLDGIAGLYNVPMELVDPSVKKAYQSPKEANKALITQAALPELEQMLTALTNQLVPLFDKTKKLWFWHDTSKIEALQVDKKAQAEWLNTAWWIKPNKKLEIMGFPTSDNPRMDVEWIPSNLLPIDEEDISKPIKPEK